MNAGNIMTEANETLITFKINNQEVTVPKGTTVYTAACKLGIDIPIFCYLDRLPPFGACRMCLVEVEKMGKLQTACTLEATDGMSVHTQSESAIKGREGILEFLLINHPLDCPICDRGGECPLQEQTLHYGPGLSRFFEEKRHFKKPLPLGPVLTLDRERCIVCARCTRFGDLLAGDHALEFIERGFKTEVGTANGRAAESKFIGNTIMICPVGALTSTVYRFRARPWDNDSTESTCTLCPVGCSLIFDSRDGEIMRTRSKENREVNDIWLCDKGWFGYEFSHNPERLKEPLIRKSGQLVSSSWDEALDLIAHQMNSSKQSGKVAAFGGNPLTLEENTLFQQLMRKIDCNNIDHRIGMPIFSLEEEGLPAGMDIAIGDCENADYFLFLGLDLTEEFPVIWLRVRQALNKGAQAFFFGHYAPEIAPYMKQVILHPPGSELEHLSGTIPETLAKFNEKKGIVFVGRQYLLNERRKEIVAQILSLCQSENISLNIMEGKNNSMAARLAGMRPDIGPLENTEITQGLNALQVLEKAVDHGWDLLYVAGANPAAKYSSALWNGAKTKLKFLVVQDLFLTETAQQADVVLPTLAFMEKKGTFVNIENRLQELAPAKAIPSGLFSDGEIFTKIADKLGINLSIDETFYRNIRQRTPMQRPRSMPMPSPAIGKTNKTKGMFASFAPALFDNGIRMKHNSHLIKLAKEAKVRIHPKEAHSRNIKNEDLIKLSVNGNSLQAKVKLDKGVAEQTILIPTGFDQLPIHELGNNLLNGIAVEIIGDAN